MLTKLKQAIEWFIELSFTCRYSSKTLATKLSPSHHFHAISFALEGGYGLHYQVRVDAFRFPPIIVLLTVFTCDIVLRPSTLRLASVN